MNTRDPTPSESLLPSILSVLVGLAFFSAMDAVMKGLSTSLGAYNALFWRMMAGCVLASVLFFSRPRTWPKRAVLKIHLIRGCVGALMAFIFFWGLVRVPLGEAIGLSFIAPLIALYLAAMLLKEVIGSSAIVASLLGLVGVLIIVAGKMGGTFDADARWGVAAILFSATLYAYNLVLQRQQALVASPVDVAFFQNVIVGSLLLVFAPFFATVPESSFWPQVLLAAVLAVGAAMVLSWGYARAEAQHLVSLEYTGFLWAVFFGWLFFDESVTWATLAGTALIVAACSLAAHRKRRKTMAIASGEF